MFIILFFVILKQYHVYVYMSSVIEQYINTDQICIFSKTTCGYCSRAKRLLTNDYYYTQFNVIELDQNVYGSLIANELIDKTGQTTVPNIFVYGKHIGGYTELKKLHDSGELTCMIRNKNNIYSCDYCGKCFPKNGKKCGCFHRMFDDWGSPM